MSLGDFTNWLFGGKPQATHFQPGPRLEAEGKPVVQLPADPEAEIHRAEKLTHDPVSRAVHTSHISALYELVVRADVSSENLAKLTAGLACQHKLLRDEIAARLMNLSHYFAELRREFFRMMDQSPPEQRLELIKAVWKSMPPRSTAVALLAKGLSDPSDRVRYFAVDRIRSCELRDLIPQLEELRQRETDDKLLRFIDFNLGLLETGFYVERKPDTGDHLVTVYLGNGGLASRTIPADEYSPARVQQTLERLRGDWARLRNGST